jgi:hypothetical protein
MYAANYEYASISARRATVFLADTSGGGSRGWAVSLRFEKASYFNTVAILY